MLSYDMERNLFNLSAPIEEMIIIHLYEDIEECGYLVNNILNNDITLTYKIGKGDNRYGVRIDRQNRLITVSTINGADRMSYTSNDWNKVVKYLKNDNMHDQADDITSYHHE